MKMLCCHDDTGLITNMIFEPIPAGFDVHYDKLGLLYSMFDNPDELTGLQVSQLCHVVNGAVVTRPNSSATVAVNGRVVTIDDVQDGSTVHVLLNAGTPFEHRETITDYVLEFDEAGTLDICIVPPWPYLEVKYRVEIQ
jgi:hypothetical protein